MVPDQLCRSLPFMVTAPWRERCLIRSDPLFARLGGVRGSRFDGLVFAGNPFLTMLLLAGLPSAYRVAVIGAPEADGWPFELLDEPVFRELFVSRGGQGKALANMLSGMADSIAPKVLDRDMVGVSDRFGVASCSIEQGVAVATLKPVREVVWPRRGPENAGRRGLARKEVEQALSKVLAAAPGVRGSDRWRVVRRDGIRPVFLLARDVFCTSPTQNIPDGNNVRRVCGVADGSPGEMIQCAYRDVSQVLGWVDELKR